jgi:hypothetical protein
MSVSTYSQATLNGNPALSRQKKLSPAEFTARWRTGTVRLVGRLLRARVNVNASRPCHKPIVGTRPCDLLGLQGVTLLASTILICDESLSWLDALERACPEKESLSWSNPVGAHLEKPVLSEMLNLLFAQFKQWGPSTRGYFAAFT